MAVPPDALAVAEPSAIVVRSIPAGSVLTPADIGDGDPRFAFVEAGEVAFAVPAPAALPDLRPGDALSIAVVRRDGRIGEVPYSAPCLARVA